MMFEALEKAGINGIVCGAGSAALFGSRATINAPFTNSSMPLWLFSTLIGGCSSFVGDLGHLAMNQNVNISEKWNNRSTLLISAAINTGLFYGGMCVLSPQVCRDFGMLRTLLVAGGGELVGSALYSYAKENLYI